MPGLWSSARRETLNAKNKVMSMRRSTHIVHPLMVGGEGVKVDAFRAEASVEPHIQHTDKAVSDVESETESVYMEAKVDPALLQKQIEERFEQELARRREKKVISEEAKKKIQQEIDRTRSRIDQIYSNTGMILNPGTAWMNRWNALMLSVILFSALWTPFEVSFLQIRFGFRFILNRVVDLIFFVDLIFVFFKAFQDPVSGKWVRNHRAIMWRYVKGRLLLDLCLSLGCFVSSCLFIYSPSTTGEAIVVGFHLLRLTHFMRMSPLAKDLMYHYQLFDGNDWTYNRLTLVKFIGVIAFVVHFMSCSWRLVAKLEATTENYYDTWIMREGISHEPPIYLYVVCLYWSTTTITTIGYGDIANPGTPLERVLAVCVMLCGALVWAYIIGGVTAVVSSFNLEELEFYEQMDQLNQYMASKRMALPLRQRLRSFFRHRRSLEQDSNYSTLLEKMSPTLRGEVARTVSQEWLKRVPWLNNGSLGFIASVAIALQNELYAPRELIVGTQLRVLTRGVVAKNSRIYTSGSVWGIDIILTSSTLKNMHPARALTFAHILSLDSDSLEELLCLYPRERSRIRASAIWLGLRRSFVKYAQQMKTGRQIIHRIAEESKTLGVDFERVFRAFDQRGRDCLSKKEFFHAIRTLGYCGPSVLLEVILSRFDKDGDRSVDCVEFVNYFVHEFAFDSNIQPLDKNAYIEHLDFKRLIKVKELQDDPNVCFEKALPKLFVPPPKKQVLSAQAQEASEIPLALPGHSKMEDNDEQDGWGNMHDEAVVVKRGTSLRGNNMVRTASVQKEISSPSKSSRGSLNRSKSVKPGLQRENTVLMKLVNAQSKAIKGEEGSGLAGGLGGTVLHAAALEQRIERMMDRKLQQFRDYIVRDIKTIQQEDDESIGMHLGS